MKPLVLLVDGPFRTGHRRLNCYSHDVVTQTRHHINYVPRYYRNCKPFRKKKKIVSTTLCLTNTSSRTQPHQDTDASFLHKTARHGRRLTYFPIPLVTANTTALLWWQWLWWWSSSLWGEGRPVNSSSMMTMITMMMIIIIIMRRRKTVNSSSMMTMIMIIIIIMRRRKTG